MTEARGDRGAGAAARFDASDLRSLRPWAAAFEEMPEAQVRLIGSALEAIEPLIETADAERRLGRTELVSFDDVAPRGSIERLIMSEFAWLAASRSEFIRRIAENEALRRQPVHQDPADDRGIVLLVESGPAMLGRKRLLALGALFALGRTARSRGTTLHWTSTGFSKAPLWVEGVDRRSLSRFVHQTAPIDWSADDVRARLDRAPIPIEEDALWLVRAAEAPKPRSAPQPRSALEPGAAHVLEIDELWPDEGLARRRPTHLRASLTARSGLRREAVVPPPSERLAAETLRAPFQLRGRSARPAVEHWAPHWLSLISEGGDMLARLRDELILRPTGGRALRIRLPDKAELLGARSLARGGCVVFWRAGATVSKAVVERGSKPPQVSTSSLAENGPLVSGDVPLQAVPPALRFGRDASYAVTAPDGSAFRIVDVEEWRAEGLDVAPHETVSDVELLAWAQGAVLARKRGATPSTLLLHKLRSGNRRALDARRARAIAPPIRRCLPIGETGGALIADAEGLLWLPVDQGGAPSAPPQPSVATGAMLVHVAADAHGSWRNRSGLDVLERPWMAEIWSESGGLTELSYRSGAWRSTPLNAPQPDARVCAMIRTGKVYYAAIADAANEAPNRLMQFRRGDAKMTPCADSSWLKEAPCVRF